MTFDLQTTAAITYSTNSAMLASHIQAALNTLSTLGATDAVQTISIPSSTTGGTFTLTYSGSTTSSITYSDTPATLAANVESALTSLSNIGTNGNVNVLATSTTVTVIFQNALGGESQPLMALGDSLGMSIATTAAGSAYAGNTMVSAASASNVSVKFVGVLANSPEPTFRAPPASFTGGSSPTMAINNATLAANATEAFAVKPAAASRFAVTAPSSVTAGSAFAATVTAQDAFGNTVSGYTGTIRFNTTDIGSGVTLPANYTFTTADAGVHVFSSTGTHAVKLVTAGSQTLSVADMAASGVTGNAAVRVAALATVTQLVLGATTMAIPSTAFTVTVSAEDSLGNVVTGYTGTIEFTKPDMTDTVPSNYTFTATDKGVHVFTSGVSLVATGPTLRTLSASDVSNGSIQGSAAISVTNATHFGLTFSYYNSASAPTVGTPFLATVTAYNSADTTATGYVGTVQFSGSDSKSILPAIAMLDDGVGTFSLAMGTAGTQTITVSDTSASITGSSSVTVSAAAGASQLVMTAPATATAGGSITVTVKALDLFGNLESGYSGTVHFSSTDPLISSGSGLPNDATLSSGSATFTVTIKTAGNEVIIATDNANSNLAALAAVTVQPAAVSKLQLSYPPVGSGDNLSLTVAAEDTYGNVIKNYSGTVHFTDYDVSTIPADYTFVPSDFGVHVFSGANGITMSGSSQPNRDRHRQRK